MARLEISSVSPVGLEERIDTNFTDLYTTVYAASANFTQTCAAAAFVTTGLVSGGSASFTATCAAATIAASGSVTGAAVTSTGVVSGATANFTATCAAAVLVSTGLVSGGSASFTATCAAATLTATTGTLSGDVSAATISGSVVATQANQETGTSTTTVVTPGRQHFHASAAKGWVKADAAGVATVSYNVTSITDGGTGDMTVVWATDFSSGDYCTEVSVLVSGAIHNPRIEAVAAGTTQCANATTIGADPTAWFVTGFGDFA